MFNRYALAEILHMPVAELMERITVEEFNGWMAYLKMTRRRGNG